MRISQNSTSGVRYTGIHPFLEDRDMLKSYEALYEGGRLKWVRGKPDIKEGVRVIVVVEAESPSEQQKGTIHRAVEEARGAWGSEKSLEEIDREIAARRLADWPGNGAIGL